MALLIINDDLDPESGPRLPLDIEFDKSLGSEKLPYQDIFKKRIKKWIETGEKEPEI